MSRYEWERGAIKIPASEWAGLKKSIRDKYNNYMDTLYNAAVEVYEATKQEAKGKRNFSYSGSVAHILYSVDRRQPTHLRRIADIDYTKIQNSLFPKMDMRAPAKPKKKDFPKMNNKSESISFDDADVFFRNSRKELCWSVNENNHACDSAREHPIGQIIFQSLSKINWTRGSGGIISGNDEYNRDDTCAGGGANYVTQKFGPKGDRDCRNMFDF